MDIIYNEESQQFLTVPDGDVASHKEIKEDYDNVIEGIKSNYVPKGRILRLINLINVDCEYNKKKEPEIAHNPLSGSTFYEHNKIVYTPEMIKSQLELIIGGNNGNYK